VTQVRLGRAEARRR